MGVEQSGNVCNWENRRPFQTFSVPLESQSSGEILPLVDRNDVLISWAHHKELYGKHADRNKSTEPIVRTSAIAMIRRSKSTGELELLVQQRHKVRERWPDRLDIASEHGRFDRKKQRFETAAETALRGAYEEYTLSKDNIPIEYHYKDLYLNIPGIKPIGKMVTVFVAYFDDIDAISYEDGDEVAIVMFMSKVELHSLPEIIQTN